MNNILTALSITVLSTPDIVKTFIWTYLMSGFNNVVYEYFFKITILLCTYITCILKFIARHNCFCKIHCYNKTSYLIYLWIKTVRQYTKKLPAPDWLLTTLVFQHLWYFNKCYMKSVSYSLILPDKQLLNIKLKTYFQFR